MKITKVENCIWQLNTSLLISLFLLRERCHVGHKRRKRRLQLRVACSIFCKNKTDRLSSTLIIVSLNRATFLQTYDLRKDRRTQTKKCRKIMFVQVLSRKRQTVRQRIPFQNLVTLLKTNNSTLNFLIYLLIIYLGILSSYHRAEPNYAFIYGFAISVFLFPSRFIIPCDDKH